MSRDKIKKIHHRIRGLDSILERIERLCPEVKRIIPGRISRKRRSTPSRFTIQYETDLPARGLKCLYSHDIVVQEVFLVTDDPPTVRACLEADGMVD